MSSVWKLDQTNAVLDDGRLRARIDLLQPALGLGELCIDGRSPTAMNLLGIEIADLAPSDLSAAECYARVDDLVATYRQTEARPFRLQVYWRRLAFTDAELRRNVVGFELQVSINTSLLDTRPSVTAMSRLSGRPAEYHCADTGDVLIRPDGAAWSSYFAAHPSDDCTTTAAGAAEGVETIRHSLFGLFLEKGVIVRARIRAAFVPREGDEQWARAVYDDFLNAPLPLTT